MKESLFTGTPSGMNVNQCSDTPLLFKNTGAKKHLFLSIARVIDTGGCRYYKTYFKEHVKDNLKLTNHILMN